ncbi:hypothetical protein ABVT39_013526 [Epinephelus coioides]
MPAVSCVYPGKNTSTKHFLLLLQLRPHSVAAAAAAAAAETVDSLSLEMCKTLLISAFTAQAQKRMRAAPTQALMTR